MDLLRTLPIAVCSALLVAGCGGGGDTTADQQAGASSSAQEVAPANPGDTPAQPGGGVVTLAGIRFAPAEAWTDLGPSRMRKAQYTHLPVEADAEPAELNVFYFGPNQGGDVESNIARWVGQMEAPDGGDAGAVAVRSKLTTGNGLDVHFVEVDGTYNMSMGGGPMTGGRTKALEGYRMVGAIVEAPQGLVFFKLTGPEATAKAMEEEMRAMLAEATEV